MLCAPDPYTLEVVGGEVQGTPLQTIFGFLSQTDDLVVLDKGFLDRETTPQYRFSVVAVDEHGATSSANITVAVKDINDQTPFITNAGYGCPSVCVCEHVCVASVAVKGEPYHRMSQWALNCFWWRPRIMTKKELSTLS